MAFQYFRLSLKRIGWIIALTTCAYLIIGHSLMPPRLNAKKPRDILSVEQQLQQQIAIQRKARDQEKVKTNEESVVELVQNDQEAILERIRSPDINMQRGEAVGMTVHNVPDKPLVDDVTMFDELEKRRMLVGSNGQKEMCPGPENNKLLIGPVPQSTLLITNLKEAEALRNHPYLKPGGSWKPEDCITEHKVAIIIPFRDRQTHLTRLIDFLVPILRRQLLDFRFIVTEQYGADLFNKGRIMNAAFRFAERLNVSCVIFHDVDMFPQDDRNFYGCPPTPRHIGAFVGSLGYQLWYKEIVGGVLAMSMDDFRAVNGYSNMYWAWGGEDDDMGKRIMAQNLTIERPVPATGRFTMLKHVKRKRIAPKQVYKLLGNAESRYRIDGLNVTSWKILKLTLRPLYYHMYVDVGKPPPEWT